jgi:hypothetical protein
VFWASLVVLWSCAFLFFFVIESLMKFFKRHEQSVYVYIRGFAGYVVRGFAGL